MRLPVWLKSLLPGREGVAVDFGRGRVLLRATRFPHPMTPGEARALARALVDAADDAERGEQPR